uniref:Uncharacterized protein n=1 Tax=Pristionchus pacificus TaxID=54126 RepID=A0A2A6CNS2_PRIPA|eukprot:PDM79844.1 hypothetical protein PRIPAC_32423 [Pristionchus pacificus]
MFHPHLNLSFSNSVAALPIARRSVHSSTSVRFHSHRQNRGGIGSVRHDLSPTGSDLKRELPRNPPGRSFASMPLRMSTNV